MHVGPHSQAYLAIGLLAIAFSFTVNAAVCAIIYARKKIGEIKKDR